MKKILLPLFIFTIASSCAADGPDGSDANDTTENALQHVGDRIEDGFKEAVDSGVPKLGRAVERADEMLERADTSIRKVGEKVERVGDRIGRRFNEGRNDANDTSERQ